MTIVLAVVLSFVTGLSLGLLGGGGSILTVPILVYALGVETKDAIASSLVVVGTTAAIALVRHAYARNVRWRIGFTFAAMSMIGAYAGGRAAALVPGVVLLLLLGGLMVATAIAMLRSDERITARAHRRPVPLVALLGQSLALGGLMGLIGAGGGFLLVPALLLLGRLSMRDAIGTSLLVITLNSLAAFSGHARHATVAWPATGLVLVVAALGAVGGGVLAPRLPERMLRRAFGCLVLAMAVFLLAQQLPPATRAMLVPWWPLWLLAAAATTVTLCRRALRGPGALETQ
jgi:uncharacterized membrane protein YfcA